MDVLIVGASTRAAAFSALRIGLRPTCIDLFADADLAATCPVFRVEPDEYPDGIAPIAARLPTMPWLYTGAIENRPNLIDRISANHPLLGNAGDPLLAVRDPLALADAFADNGLEAPRVRLDPAGLPLDGSWLRKPLASAGGRGIARWIGQPAKSRSSSYYQERIEGLPVSAIYVGASSGSRCLGITRQFVGKAGNRFAYRGSLAPWPVGVETKERVEGLGEAIVGWFGLRGLFGIDLILQDGRPWPVEVNPRYTASVEVLEWALSRSILAEHLRASGVEPSVSFPGKPPGPFVSKAIIQASRLFRWPADWIMPAIDPAEFPEVADIPQPGSVFQPGDPVLTVFARGDSPSGCRRALATRLKEWRSWMSFLTAS